jgi:hypothetical protein
MLKLTLAERANISPANQYEVAQLYTAGALSVACVGVQCIGYDHGLSTAIMEAAHNLAVKVHRRTCGQHGVTPPRHTSLKYMARPQRSAGELRSPRFSAITGERIRKHSF